MKKIFIIIISILVLAGLAWAGNFYWRNLRGAAVAFKSPSENIADVINTTGMPLSVPPGFSISIFADDLDSPRVMVRDPRGTMLVSEPGAGKILALPDMNGDDKAGASIVVADHLDNPHGLAFKCDNQWCKLYVGETSALSVFDYNFVERKATNRRVLQKLPSGGSHTTRALLFEPSPNENKLLVEIGSSCNVCNETDQSRAKIFEYDTATNGWKEFAKGLRSTVFMAIHPVTGDIWATENGRDLLGDNIPPDEVNIIKAGNNYGWPICYGQNIHDTEFDKNTYIRNPCMTPLETPSHIDIQAHSAPLGLAFFGEESWPEEYWYNMLVAYHGSWNRTVPTGYKIVRYKLDAKGNVLGSEDFITGWQKGTDVLGRPVGIMIEPGKIYVSDDKAGVIYLVKYTGKE